LRVTGVQTCALRSILWLSENEMPELIFMDIQLADGLSFEIFRSVEIKAPIIFTTAFDQYAIQAFKVNSVDYLLKPIQKEDLDFALNKFKDSKKAKGLDQNVVHQLLENIQQSKRKGILVKDGKSLVQLSIDDLLYFYSKDSISFGITKQKRYIIEETIDQLYDSLDKNDFFRINRGQIISKIAIEKIEPYFNHRLKLQVANARDQEFVVSRPRTTDFKQWLNS